VIAAKPANFSALSLLFLLAVAVAVKAVAVQQRHSLWSGHRHRWYQH
jgi:hypothetical protein